MDLRYEPGFRRIGHRVVRRRQIRFVLMTSVAFGPVHRNGRSMGRESLS